MRDHQASVKSRIGAVPATLDHPDLWQLLAGWRRWTPEQWEEWFGDASREQLLAHSD